MGAVCWGVACGLLLDLRDSIVLGRFRWDYSLGCSFCHVGCWCVFGSQFLIPFSSLNLVDFTGETVVIPFLLFNLSHNLFPVAGIQSVDQFGNQVSMMRGFLNRGQARGGSSALSRIRRDG